MFFKYLIKQQNDDFDTIIRDLPQISQQEINIQNNEFRDANKEKNHSDQDRISEKKFDPDSIDIESQSKKLISLLDSNKSN